MTKYEVLYVIHAGLEDQARQDLINRFNTLITDNGGTVDSIEEWGKRRLAYPIRYETEGYYVLLHISAEPTFPQELERNFQITEQILRYLVTLIEK